MDSGEAVSWRKGGFVIDSFNLPKDARTEEPLVLENFSIGVKFTLENPGFVEWFDFGSERSHHPHLVPADEFNLNHHEPAFLIQAV